MPLAVGVQDFEEFQISGKKFSTARKRLVLTQQELAEKLQMSLSNVRRIERQTSTTISPRFVRKLAELRGISAEDQLRELATGPALSAEVKSALAGFAVLLKKSKQEQAVLVDFLTDQERQDLIDVLSADNFNPPDPQQAEEVTSAGVIHRPGEPPKVSQKSMTFGPPVPAPKRVSRQNPADQPENK